MRLSVIILIFLIYGNLFAQNGGNALSFDGLNDYVESMNNIGITGNSPRTVSAWVKSAQLYTASCCPTPFSWGAAYSGGGFGNFIGGGKWWFWGYQNDINTGVSVNIEWNHHCITYDGSEVIYYLNGNVITRDSKNLNTAVSPLFIGDGFDHRLSGNTTPFNGQVDEVKTWKVALSQEEILEHIFRTLKKEEIADTNLIIYWRFNEGLGSSVFDSSNSDNHGALVNIDTTISWVPSTVPLATGITASLNNITAIWSSVDSATSSIFSVQDSTISGDDAIIFGHNNNSVSFDTLDIPTNLGILQRLKRIWRLEIYGTFTGEIIFDVKNLEITNGNALNLLVDSDGVFSDADTVNGLYNDMDSIFVVSAHNFQHGYYYTLGTQDSPSGIESHDDFFLPGTPYLFQNYPNPFNPTTVIKFRLQKSDDVRLMIYNLSGHSINTLINNRMTAGTHHVQWNGRNADGIQVSSGIYIYTLKVGSFSQSRKMILLR